MRKTLHPTVAARNFLPAAGGRGDRGGGSKPRVPGSSGPRVGGLRTTTAT